MVSNTNIEQFIRSTFLSVWALELVLLMASERGRNWTRGDLVAALRASDLVVSRAVDELTAAGLILADAEDRLCFHPVSEQLELFVNEVAKLYARSPDKVRRLIVMGGSPLSAFADAFRIRKD